MKENCFMEIGIFISEETKLVLRYEYQVSRLKLQAG